MRVYGVDIPSKEWHNRYRRVIRPAVFDAWIVIVTYFVVLYARLVTLSSIYVENLGFILAAAFITVAMLYAFGVYRRIWSRTSGHGIVVIINGVASATLVIVTAALIIQPRPLPLSVIFIANLLAMVGFVGVRYRSRLISGLVWRWKVIWINELPPSKTRVLIIGAGESGQDLALRLKHRLPGHQYHVVGFIDDDPDKQNMYVEGCRVMGTRQDIIQLASLHNVDLIVVAIHNVSGADFREILSYCEATRALIKVVPDLFALVNAKHTKDLLRDVQVEDYIGRTVISHHEDVDLSLVANKVILITGAAGSIGSELSRQILNFHPTKVLLLDNNESGLHDLLTELKAAHHDAPVIPTLIDITATGSLRSLFETHRPQIVFHAAAYKHVPMLEYYPEQALRVNIHGTVNVAELSLNYGVERFVLISTDKAVCPSSIMGASKRICELLLHALSQSQAGDTIFTSVRFGNVLGSRGSVVPTFNRQIDSGGPVTVTHEEMTRYFMSIPEAVNLIIHAACMTQGDDIFVLQMGEVVRIVELAERMIRMRGLRPYIDIDIEFTGMRPGEKLHEVLFNEQEKPVETLHPHIVKIEAWGSNFDVSLFLEGLGRLSTGFSPDHALNMLQDIIEGKRSRTIEDVPL